jgi:HTH-type transcriptional regulator, glycine betaine synthesis regulator
MNNNLELAQDKFIDNIGKLCDSFGLNRFIAQLYAVLYLSHKPLSLDEITEKLKVSKGNVSINIRELENWGAVRSVWVKGSRKDYYEANLDVKGVIMKKVKSGIQKRVGETSEMVDSFKNIIRTQDDSWTEEEKAMARVYEDRLKKIEELKALATAALAMADRLF